MHVLVTGGAGFIGTNLVEALLGTSGIDHVTVIDDLSNATAPAPRQGVRFVKASILDEDALNDAANEADAVIHLAALGSVPRSVADPLRSITVNVTGTANVLEAARRARARQVIVASSSSVYGANPTLPKHEGLVPQPMSPYAVSKLATETAAIAWAHCYGLTALAFRFFNVYGPHQPADHDYAAVIPRFVAAALRGEPLTVHGDGSQTRDFTFVDTVTSTLVDAVLRGIGHTTPVNLALGTRASLNDVIAHIERILGRAVERHHTATRTGDVPHSQADPTLLTQLFPAVAATTLADGVAATVGWMRALQAAG